MKNMHVLGIDIAKNIFELCGIDEKGAVCYRKRVSRKKFLETVIQLRVDKIGMEACGGANHWCRTLEKQGIHVKLMHPAYVKPYIQTNKNDRNDASGIAEACTRDSVRAVRPKSIEQQDMQSILRIRERLVRSRTSLINEIRGLLLEYGVIIPQGARKVYKALPEILDEDERVSPIMRGLVNQLYTELLSIDENLKSYGILLDDLFDHSSACQRLEKVPGIGRLTALAIVSLVGNIKDFKNSRQFSAFLGLVPKQRSSGGKSTLLGISKRGDTYTRMLLIHGARTMLRWVDKRDTAHTRWLKALKERRGFSRACVALANKHARTIWALLTHKEDFDRKQYESSLYAEYN